jgi:hypothetical protein
MSSPIAEGYRSVKGSGQPVYCANTVPGKITFGQIYAVKALKRPILGKPRQSRGISLLDQLDAIVSALA